MPTSWLVSKLAWATVFSSVEWRQWLFSLWIASMTKETVEWVLGLSGKERDGSRIVPWLWRGYRIMSRYMCWDTAASLASTRLLLSGLYGSGAEYSVRECPGSRPPLERVLPHCSWSRTSFLSTSCFPPPETYKCGFHFSSFSDRDSWKQHADSAHYSVILCLIWWRK